MWKPTRILFGICALVLIFPGTSPAIDFGGAVEADLTWSLIDSPVNLTGDVRISSGATLTIEYGVEVHLNGHVISSHWPGYPVGYLSAVGGTFHGSSSLNENIFIKPDDLVEFCSFLGVRLLLNSNGGTLSNCNFTSDYYGIMIQGQWDIRHCIFEDCAVGIWMQLNVPASIRNCNFIGGDEGFHFLDVQGFPEIDIRYNNFLSVGQGIVVEGVPGTDFIDAILNYWGGSNGPTHVSNPGGTGAPVGDGVSFVPWLTESATAASDVRSGSPLPGAMLRQNSPNPFNPWTTIAFNLPRARNVDLVVYSLSGRRITTLVDAPLEAGYHEVTWRGTDDHGREVSSGTYFYRLEAGSFFETKRMLLVK